MAIEFAEAIFKALGIADGDRWKLSHFDLAQVTLVQVREGREAIWIPFEKYLKRVHKLPVLDD